MWAPRTCAAPWSACISLSICTRAVAYAVADVFNQTADLADSAMEHPKVSGEQPQSQDKRSHAKEWNEVVDQLQQASSSARSGI